MFKFPFLIASRSKYEALKETAKNSEVKVKEAVAYLASQSGLAGAVLRSVTEGVLAVDEKGGIILANLALERMFCVIEPEIIGKTVRGAIKNNEIAELIEETLKTGGNLEKEIEIVTPIERSFAAVSSLIRGEGGRIYGAVCVLHDISEIKKLIQHRSEFVANVSHELKTPLTAIKNYVETLLNGAIDDREHNREFLNKVNKHADNLTALIDDLLEISSLESRKELGPFIRIDLKKVLARAVETVSEKAKKKKISIEKKCGGGEFFVSGIEDHIYRAFLNLLDNAVNYTGEGGRVTINCALIDGRIEVSFTDDGIGIPTEHLPRIFERFYRVDKARSRDLGGTGLGLAIVKHVANIHNGTVSVKSEENKGSIFTIILPAV